MIRTASILTLLLLTIPAAAQDAARPYLKRSAVITGDVVKIGDLIENAGLVADVPIFRAPDLGDSGSVSAARVAQAVRSHAIIGLDTKGLTEVAVSRPSRAVSGKDLQTKIAELLADQYSLGDPASLAINFERELRTVNLDPATPAEPRVIYTNYDFRSGRFDMMLEFSGLRQRFTGTAVAAIETVILARSMARGEVIRHADILVERRPKAEVGRDTLKSIELVVGRAARSNLRAGQPLRAADIMKPELVQRDANVTLIYQVPGITLTVRGKANESGAEGDTINVTNLQSKRIVQGTVTESGAVVVGPSLPKVVANLEPSTTAEDATTK
jgi:flagella basal body P-ring formation protein FlgA